jgi:hypothetical protein
MKLYLSSGKRLDFNDEIVTVEKWKEALKKMNIT